MTTNSIYRDRDFAAIFDSDKMKDFLRCRAFAHSHYYHYTTADGANGILQNSQLWLAPLGSNDRSELAGRDDTVFFQISFCSGESENLPLWYLYSGIDGKGVRLGLTKTKFSALIRGTSYSLHEYNRKDKSLGDSIDIASDEFSVVVRDILYIGESSKREGSRIKYNGKQRFAEDFSQKGQDISKFTAAYKALCPSFHKGLIWYYEKETRWLVELPRRFLASEKDYKDYRVVAEIPNTVYNNLKIRFAPEVTSEYKIEIIAKDGFQKFCAAKFEDSDYFGEVDMSLAERLCGSCAKSQLSDEKDASRKSNKGKDVDSNTTGTNTTGT